MIASPTFSTAALLAAYVLSGNCLADGVTSFEDIRYWIGSGENRAAMVIDWDHTSSQDESLVWGFRWDEPTTGEDMLRAIVEADSRLYLRHGTSGSFGLPIYGLGYDENHDDQFALTTNVQFSVEGFAETSVPDQPPIPPGESVNEEDRYAEGFFTGFWHYATAVGEPFAAGSWTSSAMGLSSRELVDGAWDGWTFETPPSLMPMGFPANPIAAEAPITSDYDSDGDVDGHDFLHWQHEFDAGTTASELLHWQQTYGTRAPLGAARSIPEPSSLAIILASLIFLLVVDLINRHRTTRNCIS